MKKTIAKMVRTCRVVGKYRQRRHPPLEPLQQRVWFERVRGPSENSSKGNEGIVECIIARVYKQIEAV